MQDEVIREVRRVREEIARRNGYDVRKIVADIQARAAQRKVSEEVEREECEPAEGSA